MHKNDETNLSSAPAVQASRRFYESIALRSPNGASLRRSRADPTRWAMYLSNGREVGVLGPEVSGHVDSALAAPLAIDGATADDVGGVPLQVIDCADGRRLHWSGVTERWEVHDADGSRVERLELFESSMVEAAAATRGAVLPRGDDIIDVPADTFSIEDLRRVISWYETLKCAFPDSLDGADRVLFLTIRALFEQHRVKRRSFSGKFSLEGTRIRYRERDDSYEITVTRAGAQDVNDEAAARMAQRCRAALAAAPAVMLDNGGPVPRPSTAPEGQAGPGAQSAGRQLCPPGELVLAPGDSDGEARGALVQQGLGAGASDASRPSIAASLQRVSQPVADECLRNALACLEDVVAHHGDFVSAVQCRRQAASGHDRHGDDAASYWDKQERVLERMNVQAATALPLLRFLCGDEASAR